MSQPIRCLVRVYILSGTAFAQRDLTSLSDPYLIIKCGKDFTANEQENYQLDTADPEFFKCYEFETSFPGAPVLEIEAWDYDSFFSDDFIGKTELELDDRYLSTQWQALKDKPVEVRKLHHPESSQPQGFIRMWVEISDSGREAASKPPVNI